jgi:hypothetical protein
MQTRCEICGVETSEKEGSFCRVCKPPLSPAHCYVALPKREWEDMHCDAEIACLCSDAEREKTLMELRSHIFRMSEEIRRLRHKCGEDVWWSCSTTKEQDEEERARCRAT